MNGRKPTMTFGPPLARELAELTAYLADLLLGRGSVEDAVQSLAQAALEAIPHVCGAVASLIDHHGRRASTGTGDGRALEADRLQCELGQGPCFSAWAEDRTQVIADTEAETRWPGWTRAAAAQGVRTALSAPIAARGAPMGALKVYSDRTGAFSGHDACLLEMLARPAAALLAHVQGRDAAEHAGSRTLPTAAGHDAVPIATRIVMEREGLGRDQALARIVSLSQLERRALHETAQEIVAGRTALPDDREGCRPQSGTDGGREG